MTMQMPAGTGKGTPEELEQQAEALAQLLSLKGVVRQGWLDHGVDPVLAESVADHSWGMAILALVLPLPAEVDRQRLVGLAVLHDVAESITGDHTPGTAPPDKAAEEARALATLFGALSEASLSEDEATAQMQQELERTLTLKAATKKALAEGTTPDPRGDLTVEWLARLDLFERLLQAWVYARTNEGEHLRDFAQGPTGLEGSELEQLGSLMARQLRQR